MIETPAAALISDELAPLVDFFSIGTNDLTQFTLAADRQNADLGSYLNPYHHAVVRLIETTVKMVMQLEFGLVSAVSLPQMRNS